MVGWIKFFLKFAARLLLSSYLLIGELLAVSDPLPSWNEGPIKSRLIEYVQQVTLSGGDNFIPPSERIATFDEDGTLWVEQPLYPEFFFICDRLKKLAPAHPEWLHTEPFKSILSGDFEILKKLSTQEILNLIFITHSGMTLEAFHDKVRDWLNRSEQPHFKRPFYELVYQPMMEAIQFLRDQQFQVYIVSGGGQEFMRSYTEKMYGLPPQNIIGTAQHVDYDYQNGRPVLIKLPQILFINNKEGKPEGINLIIGKRPVIAFGNSTGDREMLEWTQANKRKTLQLLIHHDDPDREYAYGPNSKIGTFPEALMEEAKKKGWLVVSMKKDWRVVFAWNKKL